MQKAESASDMLGSIFFAQQQGPAVQLPTAVPGAAKPLQAPLQHQQQQQQQQQQQLLQRQQSQAAQWSVLQGAMRGVSPATSMTSWLQQQPPPPQQPPQQQQHARPAQPQQVNTSLLLSISL